MHLKRNDAACERAKYEQYVKFKRKQPKRTQDRFQDRRPFGKKSQNDRGDVVPVGNSAAPANEVLRNSVYRNGATGNVKDNTTTTTTSRPDSSLEHQDCSGSCHHHHHHHHHETRTDVAIKSIRYHCDFENNVNSNIPFEAAGTCTCCRGRSPPPRPASPSSSSSESSGTIFLGLCAHLVMITCLYLKRLVARSRTVSSQRLFPGASALIAILFLLRAGHAYPNDFPDKINLEDSIAAVFNKVAYGSTTKRSIPDNAYPLTTLATPLLTTYRYSDGSDEWARVDVKKPSANRNVDFERPTDDERNYGQDLERDHTLPTTAPAADILKNNNNKHYNNPNRYNNDRLRPDYQPNRREHVTENVFKTTTNYNPFRNVRPTKSIYSKDVPMYVPPSREFLTPSLPKDYFNSFADKPTLRGTSSDGFANRRPIPPPSLMPNKDRIPFRPDLPPSKAVNSERNHPDKPGDPRNSTHESETKNERKKTLNTPSHNVNLDRFGEVYGVRSNETPFEYEKGYVHSITRILSGSNGRHEDISDILLRTVTATPNIQKSEAKNTRQRVPIEPDTSSTKMQDSRKDDDKELRYDDDNDDNATEGKRIREETNTKKNDEPKAFEKSESVTIRRDFTEKARKEITTTLPPTELLNLPNVKEKEKNATSASSDEIWLICWNVHVYLVVFFYILLAAFSIYKLVRYENDPHMFSKSYFLTIHLMLTVICVLRIFYLTYDPYNVAKSFNVFLYDFLHNFPLSLLATTFAVLILFLLKRTLNHLKLKTRPMFLVIFGILHIALCFCVSISETLGQFERGGLIVCKPVFVLLTWALGFSYLYLYKIIKNVLAKKTQNLSEMCTQNISYASHITIAIALLFVLLGFVQLYALFFIKVDRFSNEIKHHWILWGFELSVRVLEISIITLLAIVVSLRMSQREKQTVGFPLFPCTTSDSSNDNIFPNNCNTNPNALNYSRNEMIMDNIPTETVERPNLLKSAFQNDSFDKKSTLERYQISDSERGSNFDRFERPKWGSERFESDRIRQNPDQTSLNNLQPNSGHFERGLTNSSRTDRSSSRKTYDSAKYYTKPKYDLEYNNEDYQHDFGSNQADHNVYSEPIDNNQYERTRHEFERNEFDRRSRNSSNTSGRRSTGRAKKNHPRPHLGAQTLPSHDMRHQIPDSMLVDDQGFVRFRHLQDLEPVEKNKKLVRKNNDLNHYSDA